MIEILFESAFPTFLLPLACLLILYLYLIPFTVHVRKAFIFCQVLIILCTGSFIVESFIGQSEVIEENMQVWVLLEEYFQLGVCVLDILIGRLLCQTQGLIQISHMVIEANWE